MKHQFNRRQSTKQNVKHKLFEMVICAFDKYERERKYRECINGGGGEQPLTVRWSRTIVKLRFEEN